MSEADTHAVAQQKMTALAAVIVLKAVNVLRAVRNVLEAVVVLVVMRGS